LSRALGHPSSVLLVVVFVVLVALAVLGVVVALVALVARRCRVFAPKRVLTRFLTAASQIAEPSSEAIPMLSDKAIIKDPHENDGEAHRGLAGSAWLHIVGAFTCGKGTREGVLGKRLRDA